ncbi:hypothetical protein COCC4DRAFT_167226 [Bipolaris maydis ATCC 48331]|uniref:Uncharacterized protein n=2 Tax=Cochliobolus heterostrophus TaxID=5016 RepID=M2UTA3_COCH5|nr:uncharacterized protein COCC4DRAFT_167226 [Bipolaris maydis ATCC 48331]EMD91117.1 hypothetical protein COCHEDRAFT_1204222 [Bipolaris maydis C5]KAH7560220.1 hypothetical protein BM1_03854 [Bipolaris maydis]ENI05802.1 hypothetical protein COCC4DRAFT_167226 [Bipolaris maydis ATCC 48331]KAJ5022824.1 hypothetical protein J3E73DRAFT_385049 [Bipolaris maydis]KAJ5064492.1 hypothetical protein J3E74DRAFT_25765 [Bipolaris maydis]
MQFIAAIFCMLLAVLGFKSLHLFATSNGLLGHLERIITNKSTPAGKPLRNLTTGGRFPRIDLQLNAVATFLLLSCEDYSELDVNLVGFWFDLSWGPSWILIVLESFREYSRSRLMSWIAIPGLFIFNQSHAIFTSLYLAIRLIVAVPATTEESLMIDAIHVHAIPWSFLLGYILPISLMALPGVTIYNLNTQHTLASFYQQWHLYISLVHALLVTLWTHTGSMGRFEDEDSKTSLSTVRPVYVLAFTMAVISVWGPILVSLTIRALHRIRKARPSSYKNLQLSSIFIPPSPWSNLKCKNAFEGGKWLLQWDGIVGGLSSAVWAVALYAEARSAVEPQEALGSFCTRLMWYMVLGGPIGVATGALWERDMLVLQRI